MLFLFFQHPSVDSLPSPRAILKKKSKSSPSNGLVSPSARINKVCTYWSGFESFAPSPPLKPNAFQYAYNAFKGYHRPKSPTRPLRYYPGRLLVFLSDYLSSRIRIPEITPWTQGYLINWPTLLLLDFCFVEAQSTETCPIIRTIPVCDFPSSWSAKLASTYASAFRNLMDIVLILSPLLLVIILTDVVISVDLG